MRESTSSLLSPTRWLGLTLPAAGEDNAAIGLALGRRPDTVASHTKVISPRLPAVGMGNTRVAATTWSPTVGRTLREHDEVRW